MEGFDAEGDDRLVAIIGEHLVAPRADAGSDARNDVGEPVAVEGGAPRAPIGREADGMTV